MKNPVGASTFPVPLVERDGVSTATVSDLLEWRKWARAYTERVCSQSNVKSDLPCIESLLTEVDWLLEDVVAGARLGRGKADGNWQNIGRLAHGNRLPTGGEVLLRETIEGLRCMWMQRMLERVPLQYLTASCHWRDLFLVVTPDVLIPRPETEKMVDLVADALRRSPTLADTPWVDLGTGSGAIAIGIANELSTMRSQTTKELDIGQDNIVVHAVDVSPAAAAVARHNVERNSAIFGKRKVAVKVHEGSWYEPLNVLEEEANLEKRAVERGLAESSVILHISLHSTCLNSNLKFGFTNRGWPSKVAAIWLWTLCCQFVWELPHTLFRVDFCYSRPTVAIRLGLLLSFFLLSEGRSTKIAEIAKTATYSTRFNYTATSAK